MDIIFDLDGTLADCQHRIHYTRKPNKDYRKFFDECSKDTPIKDNITLYHKLQAGGFRMFIVSGRSNEVRVKTWDWLDQHSMYPYRLYMRKEGDYRPDYIVKQELLNEYWPGEQKFDIFAVFDDRDQVVQMWRANGIRCYQVAAGAF